MPNLALMSRVLEYPGVKAYRLAMSFVNSGWEEPRPISPSTYQSMKRNTPENSLIAAKAGGAIPEFMVAGLDLKRPYG
jgi:hypothetical protein